MKTDRSIYILGDSIAKGVSFHAQRNRYTIAKDTFSARLAQVPGCTVTNLSKFGSTVTDGLARFEKKRDTLESGGTVLMNFGGNDSDFLWKEISAAPEESHLPRTPLESFRQTYSKLIAAVKACGLTPVILNLPPVDHEKYFSWISRELRGENILKWLGGSSEFIYRWHEQYNLAVHKLAQAANIKLIDIRSLFLERRDYKSLLSDDGIHPNEQGHGCIADAVMCQL